MVTLAVNSSQGEIEMKPPAHRLLFLPPIFLLLNLCSSAEFNCKGPTTRCQAMVGYVTANSTTYSNLSTLFQVQSFADLLGANNLPSTTSRNHVVPAETVVRIPFPCNCTNGTGLSDQKPIYTVRKGDSLYKIATDIFGGFVTYPEIAVQNKIADANKIEVDQQVWIPLPCSCDAVEDTDVVHYAHKVAAGSTLHSIAEEFGTTNETLMKLNGITDPTKLRADTVLDVPLRACNSTSIRTDSPDYGLLVPDGSYAVTANGCVQCGCNSAYQLMCSMRNASANGSSSTCPAATCLDGSLTLGGVVNGTSACDASTCTYAGNDNDTTPTRIFTVLTNTSTCPADSDRSPAGPRIGCGRWGVGWVELLLLLLLTTLI